MGDRAERGARRLRRPERGAPGEPARVPADARRDPEGLASERPASRSLGPGVRGLIPTAQTFAPAQESLQTFLRATVDPIETQIRPFTRQVRTPVRHLQQASGPLAETANGTAKSLGDINRLFNAWAYNPPGTEEGYLFWTAWLNHNANSPPSSRTRTARWRGPSCCSPARPRELAESLAVARPFIRTLQQYTNAPQSEIICPLDPSVARVAASPHPTRIREATMETRPPTAARILVAVGFAISCFGLALFLWLAFGGPIPLKPEGYRFTVPFHEATQLAVESDVRISGVSVGKVKSIELSDDGYADATIELDARVRADPRRHAGRSCARRRCSARPTSS